MEARRCATHGLVVASDGRCIICKRGEMASVAKTSSDLPVVIIVVVMGVITLGALGYAATKRLSNLVGKDDPGPDPAAVATTPAPPDAGAASPEPAPTPRRRDDFPSISSSKPEAPVEAADLTDEQIEALKRGVPVTMYARSNCGLCDSARTFLKGRRYTLTEYDVEKSATDKVVLESLNPQGTMPTFVVDGKTIVGYDRATLDGAIEAAALRRASKK